MSQADLGTLVADDPSGIDLATRLEAWRTALHSCHKGASRPSYAIAGTIWIEDDVTPWVVRMWDGDTDISLGTLNATTHVFTPSGALPLAGGTMTGALNLAKGANLAAAATLDIGAATGNTVHVVGTTPITSLGTAAAGVTRTLIADAAFTLTHHATNLILPGGLNIVAAIGDVFHFFSEGGGAWKLIGYSLASGKPLVTDVRPILQVVEYTTGAVATGTTLIPADDTIPQITEGTQFMSLAFTPLRADSRLLVEAQFIGTNGVANNLAVALFRDAGPDAIAVSQVYNGAAQIDTVQVVALLAAGSTNPTTFYLRAGGSAAGTTTFNGSGGVRRWGGVANSYIRVTEIYAP